MSMRISSGALLFLAACGGPAPERQAQAVPEAAQLPRFPCATGSDPLRPACTAERTRTRDGWTVTLRHPDGHFRRLLVKDDGDVIAADGAQAARITKAAGAAEIAVGGDRYRLPTAP